MNFKNLSLKNILTLIFGVWFIDYLTTFIALNFLNLNESNPFAKMFYVHWWGWVIFPIMAFTLLFLFSLLCYYGGKFCDYVGKKENKKIGFIPIILGISLYFLLESYVIINNLLLIFKFFL